MHDSYQYQIVSEIIFQGFRRYEGIYFMFTTKEEMFKMEGQSGFLYCFKILTYYCYCITVTLFFTKIWPHLKGIFQLFGVALQGIIQTSRSQYILTLSS